MLIGILGPIPVIIRGRFMFVTMFVVMVMVMVMVIMMVTVMPWMRVLELERKMPPNHVSQRDQKHCKVLDEHPHWKG